MHQLTNVEALGSLPICSGYTMVVTLLGKSKPYYKNCGAHNEKSQKAAKYWAQSKKAGGITDELL